MNIDKLTYFSYLSIKRNLMLPLKKFMSFNEIMECIYFKNYKKNFFPLPFFLSASSKDIKEISKNTINLFYENKKIGSIKVE